MKKYITPDMEITAIQSADIVTASLVFGTGSAFANGSIDINTESGFMGGDISGF